jgi:cell wall-associated NlpC family hydrolase
VSAFDPRLTPARPDLAAKHLEGKVTAERFAAGELCEVVEPHAPVRRSPSPDAPLDTEALKGERVTVYEAEEGWAWGQLASDGYVGYLPTNALGPIGSAVTHKVSAQRTLVFPGPDIKLPPLEALPLEARIAIARIAPPFAVTTAGGYLPARHVSPLDTYKSDFVAVAERFVGAPYLWGGKTCLGLDCSGLVQIALTACGISCPRDSDMQESTLGTAISPNGHLSNLRRGDLIFWKGHVAMVRDEITLIHANGYHMAVAIEPIGEAVARIAETGSSPTHVKRLANPI